MPEASGELTSMKRALVPQGPRRTVGPTGAAGSSGRSAATGAGGASRSREAGRTGTPRRGARLCGARTTTARTSGGRPQAPGAAGATAQAWTSSAAGATPTRRCAQGARTLQVLLCCVPAGVWRSPGCPGCLDGSFCRTPSAASGAAGFHGRAAVSARGDGCGPGLRGRRRQR